MFDQENFSERLQEAVLNLKNIINEISEDNNPSILIMASTEAKEEISGNKESLFTMAVAENVNLDKIKQLLKAAFKNEDDLKLLFVKAIFDVIIDDIMIQSRSTQIENMFKKLSKLQDDEQN